MAVPAVQPAIDPAVAAIIEAVLAPVPPIFAPIPAIIEAILAAVPPILAPVPAVFEAVVPAIAAKFTLVLAAIPADFALISTPVLPRLPAVLATVDLIAAPVLADLPLIPPAVSLIPAPVLPDLAPVDSALLADFGAASSLPPLVSAVDHSIGLPLLPAFLTTVAAFLTLLARSLLLPAFAHGGAIFAAALLRLTRRARLASLGAPLRTVVPAFALRAAFLALLTAFGAVAAIVLLYGDRRVGGGSGDQAGDCQQARGENGAGERSEHHRAGPFCVFSPE